MKTVIIGYDLDGVICPDVHWDGDISDEGIKYLHNLRTQIYPCFTPHGDFIIVTGRPNADSEPTTEWLEKNKIYPKNLHMCGYSAEKWTTDRVIEHKAKWINHYAEGDEKYVMRFFVESDMSQVSKLRDLCNIPVYHFSTFIDNHLMGMIL